MQGSLACLNAKGRFGPAGWMAAAIAVAAVSPAPGQTIPIIGETYAHDPSPIVDENGTFFYYSTGQGILSRESTNLSDWTDGPAVFAINPAWATAGVPGFTGDYWAPQVNYFDGLYHLYYAVSTIGSQVSGIGMATSPTLNPADSNYGWTDQGPVIQSTTGGLFNAIDPSVITAQDGTMWMSFGSYWQGIYEVQLNPATGLRLNPNTAPTHLSIHLDGLQDNEASYLEYHDGYYYLFENWGSCCSGTASTYNVRMGRSTSVNGPFVDESGVELLNGGGTLFLGGTGNYIGPGQVGIYSQNGTDYLSYHYYNGADNGTPAFAIQTLHWTASGWPSVNDNLTWSAVTTGSVTDGGGSWNLTSTHFVGGSGAQAWDDTGYGAVTFGSLAGPAGVVNVTQPTTVQTITFNAASSGTYTLAGSSAIALPVYATITSNAADRGAADHHRHGDTDPGWGVGRDESVREAGFAGLYRQRFADHRREPGGHQRQLHVDRPVGRRFCDGDDVGVVDAHRGGGPERGRHRRARFGGGRRAERRRQRDGQRPDFFRRQIFRRDRHGQPDRRDRAAS
jgi:arabinan endo-1,5-alpha-L-arabinosidase